MNVIQTKKHVSKLYKLSFQIIKKEYLKILQPLYQELYEEALALGFDGDPRDLDIGWLEEFFEEYNPVTKYVFRNELGRKESRLLEALVASSLEKAKSYQTAEKLLVRQVKQSAIELEDSLTKRAFRDAGVKKVQWVAESDHKTCGICSDLDGEVFLLKDAPPKQHYHCRCYLIPVAG